MSDWTSIWENHPLDGDLDRRDMAATLERGALDTDKRTVPITISTDSPISGPTGQPEILRHDADAVDLSRAAHGLPLQVAHNGRELPVGRVGELRLDGHRLRGVARFSRGERGESAWQDVVDGIITDVSVGALVPADAWSETGDGAMLAMRWQPVEVSLVAMGADPGAGILRSTTQTEDNQMHDDPGLAAARRTEQAARNRAEDIAALFNGLDGEEWITLERDALRGTDSLDVIRESVMSRLKDQAAPRTESHYVDIGGGKDQLERWAEGVEAALDLRCGHVPEADRANAQRAARESEFSGMSLRELARDYLRVRGLPTRGSVEQVIGRALTVPAVLERAISHSTSDFANLLGASAEKSLSTGYAEAPETYQAWTRNVSMSNFRQHSFTNLSLFGDLDEVPEGAEFTAGTFSDRVNTATLATYGKLFSITRQAIVNDDLDSFTTIPQRMGRSSARQVGDLVYGVITGDVKLTEQGGATLFNTTDGNLAASGAVISTTTLNLAKVALRTMTDPSGATLNIMPAYLIVPAAIESTAQTFMASEKDPSEGGTTSFDAPNVFRNMAQVIAEPRLDTDSSTQWYLFGAPGAQVDTVVVGWLDGRQEPTLEQQDGFSVDGVTYKVRIDCTAAALDWRGMYSNAGA